jgi:uncharacterized membrane protein
MIFLIILVNFVSSIILYPLMPEMIASHWDMNGIVNGYMPKFWGLFLVPFLTVGITLLLVFLPRIDPKGNIKKFSSSYESFLIAFIAFMTYIHALTLAWNMGIRFSFNIATIPAFAILFFCLGMLLGKAKQNWFIGIRTPWTLSSETVWDKTHKLGASIFKGCGILSLAGIFFPTYSIIFMLVPVILGSIYLTFYSYFEWRKINQGK